MLKHVAAFALMTLLTAQQAPSQEIQEQDPNGKPSPRIMLVIDVSGSMMDELPKTIAWTLENVVRTGTDDIEIGLITFDDAAIRYTDTDESGKTKEWFRLPAAPVLDRLTKRLEGLKASGGTSPDLALKEAYQSGAQTIILITDGGFNSGSDPAVTVKRAINVLSTSNLPIPRLVSICVPDKDRPDFKTRLEQFAKDTDSQMFSVPE